MTERPSKQLPRAFSAVGMDATRRQAVGGPVLAVARRSTQDLEYQILQKLENAQESVGSGSIFLDLRDQDVVASQATVGRVLRLLDHQRLTAKVSNRGRVLTPAGRRVLEELRRRESRKRWAEQVLREAEPATRQEFVTVLAALRLIEGNIARLAAMNATPEQIKMMRQTLEDQRQSLATPEQGADQGTAFHTLIGEACGNRFLHAAAKLIWSSNKPIRDLWYEANALTGVSSYPDHLQILKTIASGNCRKAQRAMDRHFDVFVRAVERYLSDGEASQEVSGDGWPRGRSGRNGDRVARGRRRTKPRASGKRLG